MRVRPSYKPKNKGRKSYPPILTFVVENLIKEANNGTGLAAHPWRQRKGNCLHFPLAIRRVERRSLQRLMDQLRRITFESGEIPAGAGQGFTTLTCALFFMHTTREESMRCKASTGRLREKKPTNYVELPERRN
jgi:hypothetical protein